LSNVKRKDRTRTLQRVVELIEIEETCRMIQNKMIQPSTGKHHEEKKELAKY